MSSELPKTAVAETLAQKIAALRPGLLPAETARKCEDLLIDIVGLCVTARNEDYVKAALGLDGEEARARTLPEHLRGEGLDAVSEARKVQRQLADGLEHLLADADALRCFRFMNEVMADQRVQSQVARRRAQHPDESIGAGPGRGARRGRTSRIRGSRSSSRSSSCSCRCSPTRRRTSGPVIWPRRSCCSSRPVAARPRRTWGWPPTRSRSGGGRACVETPDGPLDGRAGVTVLMRYTLRLLTAQQFQRATALVCAAEMARLRDEATWGTEPFRIGLWVGTDVSPKRYDEAESQLKRAASAGGGYRLTVLQIQRCPWCGTPIGAAQREAPIPRSGGSTCTAATSWRDCPFARGGDVAEGLPVLTVDEEIYRLAPAFVIATVDKFARLAREGEAASLFGYVSRRCDRHGYVHPDYQCCTIKDGSKHPKSSRGGAPGLPAPAARPDHPGRAAPDHRGAGDHGRAVRGRDRRADQPGAPRPARRRGRCSSPRRRPRGTRPSRSARCTGGTSRSSRRRCSTPGGRSSPGKRTISQQHPGRRYIGISTTGVRLTTAEIRIAEVLMAAGQLLLDRSGDAADPYLTLVGYFSATRELAGMARYMGDDIQTALAPAAAVVAAAEPDRHRLRPAQRRRAHLPGRERGHHRDPGPDGGPVRPAVRLDRREAGAARPARGGQAGARARERSRSTWCSPPRCSRWAWT